VIDGFEASTVPGAIERLLLAARRTAELVYVGGFGTGWTCAGVGQVLELGGDQYGFAGGEAGEKGGPSSSPC
jgi:hypothetical protein